MGNVRVIAGETASAIVERLTGQAPDQASPRPRPRPTVDRALIRDRRSMLMTAEFWVAVAFVIFMAIVWKVGGFGMMTKGLDGRAKRVRHELDEARRLREEAAARPRRLQAPPHGSRARGRGHLATPATRPSGPPPRAMPA